MSYEISYRREALRLTSAQAGHYDDVFFLMEEVGSNNCWEIGNRRRARSWQCTVAGSKHDCLAEITRCAAACCGGGLVLYGRRRTEPESYIRAWRRALAEPIPMEEAGRAGFHLQLFTRMTREEAGEARQYAYQLLCGQTRVKQGECLNPGTDNPSMEWRFNVSAPDEVKLWLDTRKTGRGWHSVEVCGPD